MTSATTAYEPVEVFRGAHRAGHVVAYEFEVPAAEEHSWYVDLITVDRHPAGVFGDFPPAATSPLAEIPALLAAPA